MRYLGSGWQSKYRMRHESCPSRLAMPGPCRYPVDFSRLARRLLKLTWPGYARELRNVIERMAILTAGERLTREEIPVEIRVQRDAGPRSSIQEARESAKRDHILRPLEANWNVSGVARGRWAWSARICISGYARWG